VEIAKADSESAMTTNHITERLHSFVLEKFPLARKRQIKPQDKLLVTGIIDSLGVLDLVAFVEQNYGLTLSDDELSSENFESIASLSSFIAAKSASLQDTPK
jgi:acyl carrier protein